MFSIKKLLLFLFIIFILFLLLQFSFLGKNNNHFENIGKFEIKEGIYGLYIDGNEINYKKDNNEETKIIFLSPFDKVLYSGELEIEEHENGKNINIGKGVYLIYITELNSKYIIKGEGFEVKNNGPATFFIDNTGVKTNIFSQKSLIELNLLDINNGEKINKIFLYPHMSIKFVPSQNNNVKNADLLKLTQWFRIDYFPYKIINNYNLTEKFIKEVIGEKNYNLDKINTMFSYIGIIGEQENKYISNIKIDSFGTLAGEKLIKGYSSVFLNDAKKVVYYKNLILRGIGKLIFSDSELGGELNLILGTLDEIKILNLNDYNQMKEIIYYFANAIIDSSESNINAKINFSKLYNSIEGINFDFDNFYILKLGDIYQNLDIKYGETDEVKYNKFYNNFANLIKNNNEKDNILNNNITDKSFLVFYLNKVIISAFNLKIDIKNIIDIFNIYIDISLKYYTNSDETRIRTGVSEYNKLIEELLSSIRNYFFLKERNSDSLLVLNNEKQIPLNEIINLENNVNSIFNYYKNNKNKLWEKESILYANNFSKLELSFTEYFSAIKNYDLYLINSKNQDRDLLFGDEENNEQKEKFSVENALNYLKKFDYLDFSNTKISIRDYNYCVLGGADIEVNLNSSPYCYKINNVLLYPSTNMDFLLTPSDYNKISNIVINGDPTVNRGSYRLDEEKIRLEELSKTEASDENLFLFKNFFYLTFSENIKTKDNENNNNNNIDENIILPEIKNENSTIKAFKSRLLGSTGELYDPTGFLSITYNNVVANEVGKVYDIKVINAKLKYNETGNSYNGYFSSKYIHSPEFVFENPEIILFDDEKNNLLLGNKVIFKGKFKTKELKNSLKPFFEQLPLLINIVDSINKNLGLDKLNISYSNIKNNVLTISNPDLYIKINGYFIESIKYKGKEIGKKGTSIYDINNILKL